MKINPLTIEALELLDAIDRRGSFAKAAEELNKATSALSYGVQKLEEQLDITIFQREGRRSVLTPAGRLILEEGRKILTSTILLAEKAKELATGWEPRIAIALEGSVNKEIFFQSLGEFLKKHETIEVDVCESVLNGGWEALELDRVDLVVGAPGPVPQQKGFRSMAMNQTTLVPVIASHHPLSSKVSNPKSLEKVLPLLRRVINHDTSTVNITRSAGLSIGKQHLYVQTIEHKTHAILSGLGIGHLPTHKIQNYLDNGQLLKLHLPLAHPNNVIAWKSSNKGKALKALSTIFGGVNW